LVDSIQKKVKVVNAVVNTLKLRNVTAKHQRAEAVEGHFDFVVSRAVTTMPNFVNWVKNKIKKEQNHLLSNGILYLKGGDLKEELSSFKKARIYNIDAFFEVDFFATKKVVHLPL